jgi:hypothetical protein
MIAPQKTREKNFAIKNYLLVVTTNSVFRRFGATLGNVGWIALLFPN